MVPVLAAPAAGRYRVDAAASELLILVYRGGRLARLGHNHVVSATRIEGELNALPGLTGSRFRLRVPLSGLTLDEPRLRSRLGEDFRTEPSEDDVRLTRERMLGDGVLDAERFPHLTLVGRVDTGPPARPQLQIRVSLHGVERPLRAPANLEQSSQGYWVGGELTLRQTDFGITPFSALGGALKVEDVVDVRFRLLLARSDE
jgi:polyisoprenoid-binding protein YceI